MMSQSNPLRVANGALSLFVNICDEHSLLFVVRSPAPAGKQVRSGVQS
jgi:hypothetical protein